VFEQAIGLKKKIRDGEQVVGIPASVATTREDLVSALDKGPYDFVSLDAQHTALNEERVAEFCAMAEDVGAFVMFRIKHTRHAYMVGNYLDLGPCGVEIPQTELDSTAEEARWAFYYPPEGGRSYGGAARRESEAKDPEEYIAWWNRFGVLWLQIESIEAVTRAHLLAQPGVDCLSFGPIDLTFSIKAHPNHALQSVDDCVAYVARSLQGSGVAVCHRSLDPALRSKYADMGVTVFLERPPT
jgi:2-keto-3-deoxy-L-rhamnonate aldolase RhmA